MPINMRKHYNCWLTFFWSGTPPAPEFTARPTLRGTPRQIKAEHDEWRRSNPTAYMGFRMADSEGNEYGFRELTDAIWEADCEIESHRLGR